MIKKVIIFTIIITVSFTAGFFVNHFISRYFLFKNNDIKLFINDENEVKDAFLNNKAPNITAKTLYGDQWKIGDYKGKVVILHFWSGSCASCDFMQFKLDKLFEKYNKRDDLVIAGVPNIYDKDIVSCYVKTKDIKWAQLFDEENTYENSLAVQFNVYSFPSIWVIDKEGIVRGVNVKEIVELEKIIERELDR